VSSIKVGLTQIISRMRAEGPGLPEAELIAAPSTYGELAELLAGATENRLKVLVWGGGSHQGLGHRFDPDLVVSTSRLNRLLAWEPDDMTVVAEAGVTVEDLESKLETRGQTAVLPERPGPATLGGVLSAGISGYRRSRYGPTRDRILEVTVVTGDGRLVKAGGRVVKNVTGYDFPRLVVGALGSMGVVVSVCLKLWPLPAETATVTIDDPDRIRSVYRPLAILADPQNTRAYLAGTPAEVEAQAQRLGGSTANGLQWPQPLPGDITWSLRVPRSFVADARRRIPPGASHIAQILVGEIAIGTNDTAGMADLRKWAESVRGRLILTCAPGAVYDEVDPWGTPPGSLGLQRRLVAAFDPGRVINPGRLPGRI
jgi:hypothetical protein